jgi:excisionase family DNA binding protein
MSSPGRASKAKTALSLKGMPPLSKTAAKFVRQHPGQARKLMAAALEAAAVQYTPTPSIIRKRVPNALKPFVVQAKPDAETITISEAAERLQISRTTAYDWIEKKRMIGWKATKAGIVIPAEQIVGPGELVRGIDHVLGIIPSPRVAWRFLSEESAFFDEPARPIDVLKNGDIKAVKAAAEAQGEAFA